MFVSAAGVRGHYHESSDCFESPQKSLLKNNQPKNTSQIFLPPNILELKIYPPPPPPPNKKNPSINPSPEIRSTPSLPP